MLGNDEESNLGMTRGFDLCGAIARGSQTKLHVGLTAAQPDITNEDFVEHDSLRSTDFD